MSETFLSGMKNPKETYQLRHWISTIYSLALITWPLEISNAPVATERVYRVLLLSAFCAKGAVSRNIGFCNKQNLAYIKCRIPSGFFICVEVTGLLPLNSHITNGGRTLVITNYDVTDNGQYICVASDGQEFAHHIFTLNDMHPETYPWTTLLTSSTTTPVPIRPGKYKDSHNTRPYHYRFLKKEMFFIWQFQFVWHYVLI